MGKIVIAALGWSEDDMTLGAVKKLKGAERIILRTQRCGAADFLKRESIAFETLDALYDQAEDFDELADSAAAQIMQAAQAGDVLYGVNDPGDETALRLMQCAPGDVVSLGGVSEGSPLQIYAGGSFRQVSALDDFAPDASVATLVREIDTPILAGEVKLRLTEVYPDETMIYLALPGGEIRRVPLWEMDRQGRYDHTCCALIPAVTELTEKSRFSFDDLIRIMRRLRAFDGDPWDIEQTHESLRRYMIEEAYEVADAIDQNDTDALYDELGDVLLQVVFHAEIGREHAEFDVSDITTAICRKMIDRHKHIFTGQNGSDDALWEQTKMQEKGLSSHADALGAVSRALPALMRAGKLCTRACSLGYRAPKDAPLDAQSMGDSLFALAGQAARQGIDSEEALYKAADRFIDRLSALEQRLNAAGRTPGEMDESETNELWKA